MTHTRLNVDLNELAFIMDQRLAEMQHFLDTETGAIHSVADRDLRETDGGDDQSSAPTPNAALDLPEWQRQAKALAAQIQADGERFVPISPNESYEAYGLMEEFIERVAEPRLRERLADAIAGKGAFRRFKDTLLSHPRVREESFRFDAAAKRRWAAQWLASLGIESTWTPPAATKD